jgi:hypothetical protein
MTSVRKWAEGEFGEAQLGDVRRTRRIVELATEVAGRPSGAVSRCCNTIASREGAFRLLENPAVKASAIRAATHEATARRCSGKQRVFVPVDGSVLSVTDETKRKGLGDIGSRALSGLHVMSALAVDSSGTVLGVCAQESWVRAQPSPHSKRRRSLPDVPSETLYWTQTLEGAYETLRSEAPNCQPWFQLDRGGDCWQVFTWARAKAALITVRATHDRRVGDHEHHLWSEVEKRGRVVAKRSIDVPARPSVQRSKRIGKRRVKKWFTGPRPSRTAKVIIRAAPIVLDLLTTNGRQQVAMNAVLVRETRGAVDDRIEWMLLTTHPIRTRAQALEVVHGYSLRWRIEDFHRMWKSGLCHVEETQLRSRAAIDKWSTILAAVATRAMRLSQLARSTPDVPATTEFTKFELQAVIALRAPKGISKNHHPTLGQAVRWVADIGGYSGPWNGPPGHTIIGRGLLEVLTAARALENLRKMR